MLSTWGRKGGIDNRFADTRSIYVQINHSTVDPASGTATVAVRVTEQTSSGVQVFTGTWQLIQSNGKWLLNAPSLNPTSDSSAQSLVQSSDVTFPGARGLGHLKKIRGISHGPPDKADKGHGKGKAKDNGGG
jgi:hypothetical protein